MFEGRRLLVWKYNFSNSNFQLEHPSGSHRGHSELQTVGNDFYINIYTLH